MIRLFYLGITVSLWASLCDGYSPNSLGDFAQNILQPYASKLKSKISKEITIILHNKLIQKQNTLTIHIKVARKYLKQVN